METNTEIDYNKIIGDDLDLDDIIEKLLSIRNKVPGPNMKVDLDE